MKILAIVGARPQFIKHAAFEYTAKSQAAIDLVTLHTGQHYDRNMSQIFFDELNIDEPKYNLNIGSGSHARQTGRMLIEIEEILINENPDVLVVYGDTNSTLAGALAAAKLGIKVAHIEAGLRSFNREMPEEINRVLTDHISDYLFCPTQTAVDNLRSEGIIEGVTVVGDIMFDVLKLALEKQLITTSDKQQSYYLATIHRPYNTDDKQKMVTILRALNTLDAKTLFPMHPRTRKLLEDYGVEVEDYENLEIMDPVSYFDNMNLLYNARGLITDSGGMQKEAYWLKKKCITIRPETEWIETLKGGWNTLLFDVEDQLPKKIKEETGQYFPDVYGLGDSSDRIIHELLGI